jgi:hypothetical protein
LLILIVFIYSTKLLDLKIGARFLPINAVILLCLATLVNQYVSAIATYLRCHKQEPLLLQSIVMGGLTCASTLVLGKLFGLYGVVGGYSSLAVLVSLPWTIWLFVKNKKAWH